MLQKFFGVLLCILAPQVFPVWPTACANEPFRPTSLHYPGILLTQSEDGTDAYDPFADYSEFDEATEEEADINFFRNGRFLTVGLIGGYRMFTEFLGQWYKGAVFFGGQLSYFFDLRFALQVSYLTGDHIHTLADRGTIYRGTVNLSMSSADLKYYFNVQNVTRGLASLNPYLLVGLAQVYRTIRYDGASGFSRDSAYALNGGAGIEIPMMRNKMYIGAEAVYHYVSFPDENSRLAVDTASGPEYRNIYPRGDILRFNGVLGINF